jgi:hypothetical protein
MDNVSVDEVAALRAEVERLRGEAARQPNWSGVQDLVAVNVDLRARLSEAEGLLRRWREQFGSSFDDRCDPACVWCRTNRYLSKHPEGRD